MKNVPQTLSSLQENQRFLKVLGGIGVGGSAAAFVSDLVAMGFRPGYNPMLDSISSLALGPEGWVQGVGFYLFSLAVFSCSLGLFARLKGRIPRIGISCLLLISVCFILIGLFHVDHRNPNSPDEHVHVAATITAAALFIASCFLTAPGLKKYGHLYRYTITTAIIAVLLFAGNRVPTHWVLTGLRERLEGANAVIWIMVMSWKVVRG
jgi:hypothetical membrane protein